MVRASKHMRVKEYESRARDLVDKIRQGATPFSDTSFDAVQRRRRRAASDILYFIETYLPHWITAPDGNITPFAPFHAELARHCLLENKLAVVAGYRESAKSTIARAVALREGVLGNRRFVVYISFSSDNSIDILQPVKLELEHNERLRNDFGELRGRGDWSAEKFVTRTGTCYEAYGRDDVIRSANYKGHRPDFVIMDDMEDPKKSMNIKQVEKYVSWIESDVLFAVNSPRFSCVFLGNWVQNPSIIHSLMTGEHTDHYVKLVLRALDDNDTSTWPDRHPTEKLHRERRENPRTFSSERMQFPRDASTKIFKSEWFRFVNEEQITGRLRSAVIWDPATGSGRDYHAILAMSIAEDMKITVRRAWVRNDESKWAAIAVWFRFAFEFDADFMVCEGNAFQKTIREDYFKYIAEQKLIPPGRLVIEPSAEKKELRISRLEGPVENGIIRFVRNAGDMNMLLYQLENYPHTNDDGPDALARGYDLLKGVWLAATDYTTVVKRKALFGQGGF